MLLLHNLLLFFIVLSQLFVDNLSLPDELNRRLQELNPSKELSFPLGIVSLGLEGLLGLLYGLRDLLLLLCFFVDFLGELFPFGG